MRASSCVTGMVAVPWLLLALIGVATGSGAGPPVGSSTRLQVHSAGRGCMGLALPPPESSAVQVVLRSVEGSSCSLDQFRCVGRLHEILRCLP